jgi:hypothetical protein
MTGNELKALLASINFSPNDLAVRVSSIDPREVEQWLDVGETPVPEWISDDVEWFIGITMQQP